MGYCSVADVEAQTGYSASDFLQGGTRMDAAQWSTYVQLLISSASAYIDKFCRRSFAVTDYVEYRDGQGAGKTTYRLNEQPLVELDSVEEDISPLSVATWTTRTARTSSVAGDYRVITQNGISSILFTNNAPSEGAGNLRITYSAGYAEESLVYQDVRAICIQIVENALMRKSKLQESHAARRGSTKDSAEMIPASDPKVVTDYIREQLAPYVRNSLRRA